MSLWKLRRKKLESLPRSKLPGTLSKQDNGSANDLHNSLPVLGKWDQGWRLPTYSTPHSTICHKLSPSSPALDGKWSLPSGSNTCILMCGRKTRPTSPTESRLLFLKSTASKTRIGREHASWERHTHMYVKNLWSNAFVLQGEHQSLEIKDLSLRKEILQDLKKKKNQPLWFTERAWKVQ